MRVRRRGRRHRTPGAPFLHRATRWEDCPAAPLHGLRGTEAEAKCGTFGHQRQLRCEVLRGDLYKSVGAAVVAVSPRTPRSLSRGQTAPVRTRGAAGQRLACAVTPPRLPGIHLAVLACRTGGHRDCKRGNQQHYDTKGHDHFLLGESMEERNASGKLNSGNAKTQRGDACKTPNITATTAARSPESSSRPRVP